MHPSFLTTDSKKLIKSEIFDGIRRSYSGRLLSELLMCFCYFLVCIFCWHWSIEYTMHWHHDWSNQLHGLVLSESQKNGGLEGIKLESLGLVIGISQLVLSCNNHRLQSPVWREFGRRFIHRIRMVFKRWRDAGYFANFVHSLWRCDRNFPQPLFSWEQLDIRARARSFFVLPRYLTVALSGPGGPRVI